MNPANSNSSRANPVAADGKAAQPAADEGVGDARLAGEGIVSLARIERLRASVPGKGFLVEELIDLFVADLPRRLGAIAQAVEGADAPALALQVHALRGGAANFGAGRLDELCGRLEELGALGRLADARATLDEVRHEGARVRDALLALKSQDRSAASAASAPLRR